MSGLSYIRVELEQGSEEWREWRREGIGASDAPVIMNENPWKDEDQLLIEKRGFKTRDHQSPAMARGIALEPEARSAYIEETGNDVSPACLQSTQYDWLRASVDGIGTKGEPVVEIKCGNSVYYQTARTKCVPDYYYGQLQHILAVTGFDAIDFWCYLPDRSPVLVTVDKDKKYINKMIRKEMKFWELVERGKV